MFDLPVVPASRALLLITRSFTFFLLLMQVASEEQVVAGIDGKGPKVSQSPLGVFVTGVVGTGLDWISRVIGATMSNTTWPLNMTDVVVRDATAMINTNPCVDYNIDMDLNFTVSGEYQQVCVERQSGAAVDD